MTTEPRRHSAGCTVPVITAGGRVIYLGKRGGIWWYRCTACGGGAGYEDPNRCFEQAVIHGRKVCDQ